MEYDIEKILYTFEDDYNPSSMAQEPRNMYAKGQLVQPSSDGSRPGYGGQPPSETSQKFINYVKGLDKKVLATKTIDDLIKDSNINIKKDTASGQLNRNNPNLKYNKRKQGVEDPETKKKITEITGAKKNKRIEIIQKVNNWTNNWFENNAGKYDSYEKAKTQLIKDWKKESKNKIYSGSNFKISLENEMPNIAAATNESTSATRVADDIFDVTFPIQRPNKELIFKKGYANYRLKNPTFNKKINDYFDLVILDKRGFNTQQELISSGQLKEGYGLVRTETGDFAKAGSKSMKGKGLLEALNIDREVLDFITTYMEKDGPFFTKTGGENIYDILSKNVDPEKVKNYKNKININVDNWRDNLDAVVKLANKGLPPTKQITSTQLVTEMKNESKKMAKLFNLKNLPPELKFYGYSQDHLLGIREALELGDPKIARQTLKTLVGTTRAQNTYLGFKEFGNKRRKLITDFNAASPKARGPIVQELNDLTKKFIPNQLEYSVKKDGSMKVKVLQPQKTQKSRIESYEIEKGKLPKKLQQDLLKLAGTKNKKCKGLLAYGGRVGLAEGLSPEFCVNEGKKVARDLVAKNIKGSPAQNSIMKRLTSGLTNFVKSTLDPKELFDFQKQFLSKGAIAALPIFDAGIAAYEAAAMGKPIKKAISDTLVFGSIPRAMGVGMDTSDVLNAKQLLKDPNLSPAGKEYAQLIIDSGDYEKMQSDTTGGMTKKFTEFKEIQDKIKNASTSGRFDYESRLNEVEGTELAKDDYSPIFGSLGNPLKNRAVNKPSGTRGGRGVAKDYKIDLSPVTYQNYKPFSFTKKEFEDTMKQVGALKEGQVYDDTFYKEQIETPMKASQFKEYMELPSFRGTQEKFSEGGIASLNVKK